MTGRSSSETKARSGSGRLAVNGTTSRSGGGATADRNSVAKTDRGTAFLSPGIGRLPSATWNVPRASAH